MNRTDRLFALLLELHTDTWTRAEPLARHFEVSVRTIYRDMLALQESGVPVVSLPGRGYRLMDGYRLPPLHFTPPEAVLLLLGADALRGAFDEEYARAAEQAVKKLLSALPDARRDEVRALRGHLHFIPPPSAPDAPHLPPLRTALLLRRTVTFTYHKPDAPPEVRRVHPTALVHLRGAWLLGAFDPVRGARRTFRLSRMEDLRVTADTYQPDPAWRAAPSPLRERRHVRVQLRFPARLHRALLERPSDSQEAIARVGDAVEVTLLVRDPQDALPWVLSWGGDVQVQHPAELRERVLAEARRMLRG